MKFKEKYGSWALITGASAGIGKCFAQELARRGLNVILVARRLKELEALASELRETNGVETLVVASDLSAPDFLAALVEAVADREVGLLVNNAGFSLTGEVVELSSERQAQMVNLNCRAPVLLSHHFGRLMKQRKRGGILNLASLAAFSAIPGWTVYAATKAFDLSLSEGMAVEMKPYGVDVLGVCPGATHSEFAEVAGVDYMTAMQPEAVIRTSLRALGRKSHVLIGLGNKGFAITTRFFPRRFAARVFGRAINMQATSDNKA